MTDRELLELAAKAAGIAVQWREWVTSRIGSHGAIRHTKHEGFFAGAKELNPLTDDGDALRLAVKLRIEVMPEVYGVLRCDTRNRHGEYFTEQATMGYSIEEATRRAIVRAAAEIGRGEK